MNNKIAAIICGVISALYLPSAFATENGSDSFALGAEGMMAGALPPAGVYLLSYYQNYHASEFQNGPDQFHVDVNAVVPRLVWMTDQKIMDGQLGFYAAQPLVDLRLKVNGMADSNQGLGDLIFGWHARLASRKSSLDCSPRNCARDRRIQHSKYDTSS